MACALDGDCPLFFFSLYFAWRASSERVSRIEQLDGNGRQSDLSHLLCRLQTLKYMIDSTGAIEWEHIYI